MWTHCTANLVIECTIEKFSDQNYTTGKEERNQKNPGIYSIQISGCVNGGFKIPPLMSAPLRQCLSIIHSNKPLSWIVLALLSSFESNATRLNMQLFISVYETGWMTPPVPSDKCLHFLAKRWPEFPNEFHRAERSSLRETGSLQN